MSFLFILFLLVLVWLFYPLKETFTHSYLNYSDSTTSPGLNSKFDDLFKKVNDGIQDYDTIFTKLTKK